MSSNQIGERKGMWNPRPIFVCDECGWRRVARYRYTLATRQPESRYEVEVLGDPNWDHIYRRASLGCKWYTVSAVCRYTETRTEAEQYAHRLHEIQYHYRIIELEPISDEERFRTAVRRAQMLDQISMPFERRTDD